MEIEGDVTVKSRNENEKSAKKRQFYSNGPKNVVHFRAGSF